MKAVSAAATTTLLLVPVALSLGGCKGKASDQPPTAEAAKAFKGAAPTADDRAAMKREEETATAYRRAHPEQFPTESAAAAAPPGTAPAPAH